MYWMLLQCPLDWFPVGIHFKDVWKSCIAVNGEQCVVVTSTTETPEWLVTCSASGTNAAFLLSLVGWTPVVHRLTPIGRVAKFNGRNPAAGEWRSPVWTRSQSVARIANRTASQHHWVTWRHRSRDHLIPHMPFPIGDLLEPSSYSNGFRNIQRRM